jgi:phosphoribosylformylglycinamidine synthase
MSHRFAVSIMPRAGILDPQGRAVEAALPQLHSDNVHDVRVGRRVELSVEADDAASARDAVERLAAEFLANPLIEDWTIEPA